MSWKTRSFMGISGGEYVVFFRVLSGVRLRIKGLLQIFRMTEFTSFLYFTLERYLSAHTQTNNESLKNYIWILAEKHLHSLE